MQQDRATALATSKGLVTEVNSLCYSRRYNSCGRCESVEAFNGIILVATPSLQPPITLRSIVLQLCSNGLRHRAFAFHRSAKVELNDDVFGGRRTEAAVPWPSEDLGLYIGGIGNV